MQKSVLIFFILWILTSAKAHVSMDYMHVEITTTNDLKNCIKDGDIKINEIINVRKGSIKAVYVNIKSYYFDSVACGGICLYNINVAYKDKPMLVPNYINGEPYNVFVILNGKIKYFTRNKKNNLLHLKKLKKQMINLPDSILCDSNLINNYVIK
jgi:hypothetical protein